jgi:hypothetical protein
VFGRIGRVTTAGSFSLFPVPTPGSAPVGITAGPDGALWFADPGTNTIGRVTTAGSFSRFVIRTPSSGPSAISVGPDGALWFTEVDASKVGRITTGGTISDFRVPTPPSGPGGIAAGADGALWFTAGLNRIGRITVDQPLEDSVDGTIHTESPDCPEIHCVEAPRYVFRVSAAAAGGDVRGSVRYLTGERAGLDIARGSVSCLLVSGNQATVGVNFAASTQDVPARAALIFLEDNGPVASDRFAAQDLPAGGAPTTCPAGPPAGVTLGPAFPGPNVAPGDPGVLITDVQTGPTDKEQCKHGGFSQFGFRNQGQCIAFVALRRVCDALKGHGREPPFCPARLPKP